MKRKHKKQLALLALALGVVLFAIGAYMKGTVQPDPPMSAPDWFEVSRASSQRDFNGFALMGVGGFAAVVAITELVRQAKKLKV